MAAKIKAKRAQSLKVELDPGTRATALGGAILLEQVMRKLGLRKLLARELPERAPGAGYSMLSAAWALIAALILGGRGIGAAELLREDAEAARVFGLEGAVPEEATMHRILTEAAGLDPRRRDEAYEEAGPVQPRMDIWGNIKRAAKLRRKKSESVEAADEASLEKLRAMVLAVAIKCYNTLKLPRALTAGFHTMFFDATDLEVEGDCFDAARRDRNGKKSMRWFTAMFGPMVVAEQLTTGNTDEGKHVPAMIRRLKKAMREFGGKRGRWLALLDAAYFEREVIEAFEELKCHFIICANQFRGVLERLAAEQPEMQWRGTGADAARGWADSQTCAFKHLFHGWSAPVTIIARRWRLKGELPTMPWHYSFVGTRAEPGDLPAKFVAAYGYECLVWMLYGSKQGCETHYKQLLSELGLHRPPSSRLGINQVFYALAAAASNVAMVLRYRVLGQKAVMTACDIDLITTPSERERLQTKTQSDGGEKNANANANGNGAIRNQECNNHENEIAINAKNDAPRDDAENKGDAECNDETESGGDVESDGDVEIIAGELLIATLRKSKTPDRDFGMSLTRIRQKYFQIPGKLIESGRTLTARLAVGALTVERRLAFLVAWQAASSL